MFNFPPLPTLVPGQNDSNRIEWNFISSFPTRDEEEGKTDEFVNEKFEMYIYNSVS